MPYSVKDIQRIEANQDRQEKVRKMALKVIRKSLETLQAAIYIDIANKLIDGFALTNSEINIVFKLANQLGKPVPTDKEKLVYWALVNKLEYRYFNQFGQELK